MDMQAAFKHHLQDLEEVVKSRVAEIGLLQFAVEMINAVRDIIRRDSSPRICAHTVVFNIMCYYNGRNLAAEPRPLFPKSSYGCFVYSNALNFARQPDATNECMLFMGKLYDMCRMNAGCAPLSFEKFLLAENLGNEVEAVWPRQTRPQLPAPQPIAPPPPALLPPTPAESQRKRDLESLTSRNRILKSRISSRDDEIRKLKHSNESLLNELEILQVDFHRTGAAMNVAEETQKNLLKKNETLEESAQKMALENSKLQADNEGLRESLLQMEMRETDWSVWVDRLENEILVLKAQVRSMGQ